MSAANVLLKPEECAMLLVDFQAGLGLVLSPSHGNSWSTMLWDWHEPRLLSRFRSSRRHPHPESTAVPCFRRCRRLFRP
jgi:hypothetical protein